MIVHVPISEGIVPGDGFRVYGSFDPLDYALGQRLLPHHVPAYGRRQSGGVLDGSAGWLRGCWLDEGWLGPPRPPGGFLDQPWLSDGFLEERPTIAVRLPPIRGFGRYNVSVRTVNRLGQESTAPPLEQIVTAVDPPYAIASVSFTSYDSVSDRVTLAVAHLTEGL